MIKQYIRPIAVAIVRRGDEILAVEYEDRVKGELFYRLLGGGIEFCERAEDALKREFMEELGVEISVLEQMEVVQNIFEFEGEKGHEVCFVYDTELTDKGLYELDELGFVEEKHAGRTAKWIKPKARMRIYPVCNLEVEN